MPYIYVLNINENGNDVIYELRTVKKLPFSSKVSWSSSHASCYPRAQTFPEKADILENTVLFNNVILSNIRHGLFGNCTAEIKGKHGNSVNIKIKLVKMDMENFMLWSKETDW